MKWPWVLLTRKKQTGVLGASWLLEWNRERCSSGCTVCAHWTLQSQVAAAPGELGQLATHRRWPPASLRAWALEGKKEGRIRRWEGRLSLLVKVWEDTSTLLHRHICLRWSWRLQINTIKCGNALNSTCTHCSRLFPRPWGFIPAAKVEEVRVRSTEARGQRPHTQHSCSDSNRCGGRQTCNYQAEILLFVTETADQRED